MAEVSVILTTYNRAHYIEQAIQSIFSQTFQDYEIIVLDDGSDDGTRELLTPFMDRIRYVWQKNSGSPIGAKNAGLQLARSTWVAYLDSDDIWEPFMLETRMKAVRKHPYIGFVYGDCYFFKDGEFQSRRLVPAPGRDNDHAERFCHDHFSNLLLAFDGILFRRSYLEGIGRLDQSAYPNADWDAIMRIALRWGAYYTDYPGVNVREHGSRSQADRIAAGKSVLKSYQKLLSEFPEFGRSLGETADWAISKRQEELCLEYLRQLRTQEAKLLLRALIASKHINRSVRLRYRLLFDGLRAGMGIETLEKLLCALMLSASRLQKQFRTVLNTERLWTRMPYHFYKVRRFFWDHKAEEAYRLRGFTRTEDYWLIADKLRSIKPKSVLDIGCGRGRYFSMFAQVERIVAIDISQKALNRIPSEYQKDPRFRIIKIPVEKFQVHEPVDLAISDMVLAHIPPSHIRRAIRQITRAAREILLDENMTTNKYYCFVHPYESLFKAEGFDLIDHKRLEFGNVLYHFRRA
ncbi:glycosyltransferase [Thermodesulfobacteriota bacterium]